jgi:hypothetical protein
MATEQTMTLSAARTPVIPKTDEDRYVNALISVNGRYFQLSANGASFTMQQWQSIKKITSAALQYHYGMEIPKTIAIAKGILNNDGQERVLLLGDKDPVELNSQYQAHMAQLLDEIPNNAIDPNQPIRSAILLQESTPASRTPSPVEAAPQEIAATTPSKQAKPVHNGPTYVPQITSGEGQGCALHALLGTKRNGVYVCPDGRQRYKAAVEKNWDIPNALEDLDENGQIRPGHGLHDYFISELDRYLKNPADSQFRSLFDEKPEVIDSFKVVLQNEEQSINQSLTAYFRKLNELKKLSDAGVQQKLCNLTNCQDWKEFQEQEPEYFAGFLNHILIILNNNSLAKELETHKSAVKQALDTKYDILRQAAHSDLMKDAYLKRCLETDYQFSVEELGVMATLFNRKLTLFIKGEPAPEIHNGKGDEEVAIFYNGVDHFDRCEEEEEEFFDAQ